MQNKNDSSFSDKTVEKKTKNKVKSKAEEPEYSSYPDISNTASANDCTGLMYAPPQSQDELESYQELSSMELPKKKEKNT